MEPHAGAEAICSAARDGDLCKLRGLLAARPALATATDSRGCTPLWWAAAWESDDAVRLLVEAAPATALTGDAEGQLPLHKAAERLSAGVVRLLLEAAPAAAQTADAKGQLPLHRATYWGWPEVLRPCWRRRQLQRSPQVPAAGSRCTPQHILGGQKQCARC